MSFSFHIFFSFKIFLKYFTKLFNFLILDMIEENTEIKELIEEGGEP